MVSFCRYVFSCFQFKPIEYLCLIIEVLSTKKSIMSAELKTDFLCIRIDPRKIRKAFPHHSLHTVFRRPAQAKIKHTADNIPITKCTVFSYHKGNYSILCVVFRRVLCFFVSYPFTQAKETKNPVILFYHIKCIFIDIFKNLANTFFIGISRKRALILWEHPISIIHSMSLTMESFARLISSIQELLSYLSKDFILLLYCKLISFMIFSLP